MSGLYSSGSGSGKLGFDSVGMIFRLFLFQRFLKALCHYIVPSVTKNSKSAILRPHQNGGKSLTSAHELVYAIAYSLVGISVIVNKE